MKERSGAGKIGSTCVKPKSRRNKTFLVILLSACVFFCVTVLKNGADRGIIGIVSNMRDSLCKTETNAETVGEGSKWVIRLMTVGLKGYAMNAAGVQCATTRNLRSRPLHRR